MIRSRPLAMRSTVGLISTWALVACTTSGARDDGAHVRTGALDAAMRAAAEAGSSDAMARNEGDASTAPVSSVVSAFYPIAEGACQSPAVHAIGATPAFVMKLDAYLMDAKGPRLFAQMPDPPYDAYQGVIRTTDHLGAVGGIDEAHAWSQERSFAGRGEDTSEIIVHLQGRGRRLATPQGQYGHFSLTQIIQQPDGSLWAYGAHSMYLDIEGDSHDPNANHDRFFAFSADGEPLKINLPGPDMEGAVRMASGELIAPGVTSASKPVLRRWSPTKKVDDLPLPNAPAVTDRPLLAVGTARAVLLTSKQQHAFYNYNGEKLQASALSKRVHDVASWVLTNADELMVAAADGTLLIESRDGEVSEEKVPEPGRLAAEPSVAWFMGNSGAVYMRSAKSWTKLVLPDGPWLAQTHPPSKIEWVKTVGGETLVSTVRTDVGFGRTKPGEVRVFYSSKPRATPLRCGAPFPNGRFAPLPPPAGPSCTNLVVVVAGERERNPKKELDPKTTLAKAAAALKGNAVLGETLTLVAFGAKASPALGILASTPEIASELTKKLATAAPHAPEIVCGAPEEQKRFTFTVKTATFAQP